MNTDSKINNESVDDGSKMDAESKINIEPVDDGSKHGDVASIIANALIEAVRRLSMSTPPSTSLYELLDLLPAFSGADDASIERWAIQLRKVRDEYAVPDARMVIIATKKLVGRAKEWYDACPKAGGMNFEQLLEELEAVFGYRCNAWQAMQLISNVTWKKGTSFSNYYYHKLNLCNRHGLAEDDIISAMIHGVEDESMQAMLIIKQFKSLSDLRQVMFQLGGKATVTSAPRFPSTAIYAEEKSDLDSIDSDHLVRSYDRIGPVPWRSDQEDEVEGTAATVYQLQQESMKEKEGLDKKVEEFTHTLSSLESVRDGPDREDNSVAESQALKRTLELERKDRSDLERNALNSIRDAKSKWEASKKIKLDGFGEESNEAREKNEQLRNAKQVSNKNTTSLANNEKLVQAENSRSRPPKQDMDDIGGDRVDSVHELGGQHPEDRSYVNSLNGSTHRDDRRCMESSETGGKNEELINGVSGLNGQLRNAVQVGNGNTASRENNERLVQARNSLSRPPVAVRGKKVGQVYHRWPI